MNKLLKYHGSNEIYYSICCILNDLLISYSRNKFHALLNFKQHLFPHGIHRAQSLFHYFHQACCCPRVHFELLR